MSHSLLVETVTGRTMAALIAARDAANEADIVELRLDGVTDLNVRGALLGRRRPVIVTCRPVWEGGLFDGSEEERRGFLLDAIDQGAEFVDIEWRAGFTDVVTQHPARVVLSVHDFSGVPKDLTSRVTAMRQTGAGVVKIAVPATRLKDCLPLLEIGRAGNAVVIAMGSAGIPSRLLATHFGSCWTYAGDGVAPGQIPAARMLDEFRFRAIGSDTAVYGVVGNNVAHSLSPVMHNAAFEAGEIDAVYVPLPAADFEDFLAFADGLGIAGASVTIPFKRDALASGHADEISRGVGAANTMRRAKSGGWDVTNTDVDGFLGPLDAVFPKPLKGARAVIMGAGGAARAVAAALVSRGAQPTIHARRREQALEVASASGAASGAWPPPAGSWDLLVNCTPLGGPTARGETPLQGGPFDGAMVYDLTYGEVASPLVREAREAGCLAIDGLPMLIAQAERQFEWWTGAPPKSGVMEAAARKKIGTSEPASTSGPHAPRRGTR